MQTRRDFLRNGSLTLLTACAATPRRALGQFTTYTRQDVTTLAEDGPELEALRQGILAMRAAPTKYELSWEGQAHIHRDRCPHGNWFFLPWHRAYLYYFEAICRQASGDPGFALPYWNWTQDRSIPAPFWDTASPLYHAGRSATATSRARDEFVGPTRIDAILDLPDFEVFGSGRSSGLRSGPRSTGELEGTPHNYTHGFVGGDMATYMSPLDPIFWLHHANVDRLWTLWRHPGNTPSSSTFLDLEMPFYDTSGDPAGIKVSDLLDTEALGYRYDTPSFGVRSAGGETELLEGESVSVGATLDVGERQTAELPLGKLAPVFRDALAAEDLLSLRLSVDGVSVEGGRNVAVRVFLGDADAEVEASRDDARYLSSFTFFDDPESHHSGPQAFTIDLQASLRALEHDPSEPVQVTLVPEALPGDEESGAVSIGGLSLALARGVDRTPMV